MIETGISQEKEALVRLSMTPGIGSRMIGHLLEHCFSASAVFRASDEKLLEVPRVTPRLVAAIRKSHRDPAIGDLIRWCCENQVSMVGIDDEAYSANLKTIADPPAVLYQRGTVEPKDNLAVAVVGSRHSTSYGVKQAERLSRELAQAGVTIVSGLARGIDAAAHRGALEAGGRTIAVIAGGLGHLYPPEHAGLAREIMQSGAVVTESAPDIEPRGPLFPQRNRIIAGLSLGVLVIEAADRSGSLITARHAGEQGREIFALPGPVTSRVSRGCHQLIRDGAQLVTSGEQILEHLGPTPAPIVQGENESIRQGAELLLNPQETTVLQSIDTVSTSIDEICRRSGLPIQRVLATISVLEMRHLIRRLSGQYVSRI